MRQRFCWAKSKQDMHMIGNTTNGKHLMTVVLYNRNDVLI